VPIITSDNEADAQYICDVCGAEITYPEGTYCPVCGRIFCLSCSMDQPIIAVKFRDIGPEHKMYEYMCDLCLREWRRKHPLQVKLDGFV
jgi:hypothetical protein